MRLFFLFISSIASFFSAFGISFITDMLCTSSETSNYFLLLSFASPLSSIKTNTQYISKLKSFSGSFSFIRKVEFLIVVAITAYFYIRSSNVIYALSMGTACYLFSLSLSAIATKLSLMSSLRRDLQGPLKTIHVYLLRLVTFAIAITALTSTMMGEAFSIGRPVIALTATSITLYAYYHFFLKQESIYEREIGESIDKENKSTKIVMTQLFISICMASWTSTDRWILGLADIPAETLNTASWSQTVSIACASICFSSLYKYVKPKKHVSLGKKIFSSSQFFFASLFGILAIMLSISQFTPSFPALERYFVIDGHNILGITLVSVFTQRAGTFLVYQEENIKINLLQGLLMLVSIIISAATFQHFIKSNILWSEVSIMLCSIAWFLSVFILQKWLQKGGKKNSIFL
ncbi:hypothetical protein C1752_03199 [Acaryochloris thomasi RCC1774]|uniref:Uncharacterized protein n=1 Tax=Acaryochloris thomasi RCC1774 TaxID=1764569 RepID=A0A2W1JGN8_9CYAN|nr:hypothetical protein [Acaryochloris thomasi]PZD72760.1 hypothetical protein C1752_03199 [Acaryochloris thomasi RCC1774]